MIEVAIALAVFGCVLEWLARIPPRGRESWLEDGMGYMPNTEIWMAGAGQDQAPLDAFGDISAGIGDVAGGLGDALGGIGSFFGQL